jgi:serine/threonine protein kinase
MGTVYLAFDPRVRRRVALKTFLAPAGLSADERRDRQVRFLREAQAAGALSHPGIVTIFEVDEDPLCDLPYIAMEYVPGCTLQQLIADRGPLPPERVREMAVTLAGALSVAHLSDVVHRDVKPANVLVREPDGAVKLVDFGVARVATSELTHGGAAVGSPAYMSPEQLRGEEVDGRSDLFSLASVLYTALCGERPFPGDDVPSVTYSIVHQQPLPITRRVQGLPRALDQFFERALAKDRSERYPNAAAFGAAFQEAVDESPAVTTRLAEVRAEPRRAVAVASRSVPRSRRPFVWAIAVAVVVVVLATWSLWRPRGVPGVEPLPEKGAMSGQTASPPEDRKLVNQARAALGVTGKAYLDLEATSSVKDGKLTVLVDGSEVYSRELSTESRNVKRFFKKVSGKVQETFDARIAIPSGSHEVVARVHTARRAAPYEEGVTVDLEPGESRKIRLIAGRTFGRAVSLETD